MSTADTTPLHFLADISIDRSANAEEAFETASILTQPPDEIATNDFTYTNDNSNINTMDPSLQQVQQAKQAAASKRKSKLKKANQQLSTSKSVLETLSSETSDAMTTAYVATDSKYVDTTNDASTQQLLSQIKIGTIVEVYWKDDDKYYPGILAARVGEGEGHVYTVHYEDGDKEDVDLAKEKFRLVGEDNKATAPNNMSPASKDEIVASVSALRTKLKQLCQNNNDDANAPILIMAILQNLIARNDTDYYVLYHTQIGKTVHKLCKDENKSIAKAAKQLLIKWKKIDRETTNEEKVAVKNLAAESKGSSSKTPPTPTASENAAIDLTDSPPNVKVQSSKPPKKRKSNKITPAPERNVIDNQEGEKEKSMPSPPDLSASSSVRENEVVVVVPNPNKTQSKSTEPPGTKKVATAKSSSKTAKGDSAKKATISDNSKQSASAKKSEIADSNKQSASTKKPQAAATSAKKPPVKKKKKKRSFHDQILVTMLTSCKPYTLKTLAKATDTTVDALRHALLSFLDKKLVICKEFPGKKGSTKEPKKLYWANPMTMSEIEEGVRANKGKGGGVTKELAKLMSTSEEIEEANTARQDLEQQHRAIQDELRPLLAIPTMKQLNDEVLAEENKLQEVQKEIQAVKDRMANASKPSAAPPARMSASYHPANRFAKPKPTKPQDPTTLKRKINHMLGEYKARKRKCIDFVEELSDAMEKKTKDVMGDKILCLDTDEAEWGMWEDCSTGKVYGTRPKQKASGFGSRGMHGKKKNADEEVPIVKIPAKYKDV